MNACELTQLLISNGPIYMHVALEAIGQLIQLCLTPGCGSSSRIVSHARFAISASAPFHLALLLPWLSIALPRWSLIDCILALPSTFLTTATLQSPCTCGIIMIATLN